MNKTIAEQLLQLSAIDIERRREPRKAVDGEVTLFARGDSGERQIRGKLKDVSANGFRIRYELPALKSGLEVKALYMWGEVTAKIMWTKVAQDHAESGFLIVP